MPSKKFFQLDESRKKELINASQLEFATFKYEDASINRIIKKINMPRGSFYLYFKDKQDLYFYILKMYIDKFKTRLIKILKDNKNDLFISLICFYDEITDVFENRRDSIKNIFINMNSEQLSFALPEFVKEELDGSIVKNFDITNYELKEEEKEILLSIVMPLFFHATALTLNDINNKEVIKEQFFKQLNIIKKGLERR